MSPWTPPVNEFNGGEKATVFEKLQSLAETVKLWGFFFVFLFFYSTGLCPFASRNMFVKFVHVWVWVSVNQGMQVLHTHTLTHTQDTRVLLISAWAAEQPLKVSLNWWMFCRAQASVFNLSHWRASTASASNGCLSSAVRGGLAHMWTFSPQLCLISPPHFLDTFVLYVLLLNGMKILESIYVQHTFPSVCVYWSMLIYTV